MPGVPVNRFPAAVCFDFYGTLVEIAIDTAPPRIWQTLCAELASCGVQLTADLLRHRYDRLVDTERSEHGEPFVLDNLFFFKLLAVKGRFLDPHTVHRFGRRFRALSTSHLHLRPFVLDLLPALRQRGCKLAIVSNTEETVTSHDLDALDLRHYFDAIVLSSTVGVRKPEPRIFHMALRQLAVSPSDCVFIGDDFECDYHGSLRAGLTPLLLCDDAVDARARCVPPDAACILAAIEDCRRHGIAA